MQEVALITRRMETVICHFRAMRYYVSVVAVFFVMAPTGLTGQAHTSESSSAEKFTSIHCFGGQVRSNGKRLTFRSYEIVTPNEQGECCGNLVRIGKTDQHGHFLVEPLPTGAYYARFASGREDVVGFKVSAYDKCDDGGHVEIKFLPDGDSTIQQYIDLDVDMSDCDSEQAYCFRR